MGDIIKMLTPGKDDLGLVDLSQYEKYKPKPKPAKTVTKPIVRTFNKPEPEIFDCMEDMEEEVWLQQHKELEDFYNRAFGYDWD